QAIGAAVGRFSPHADVILGGYTPNLDTIGHHPHIRTWRLSYGGTDPPLTSPPTAARRGFCPLLPAPPAYQHMRHSARSVSPRSCASLCDFSHIPRDYPTSL